MWRDARVVIGMDDLSPVELVVVRGGIALRKRTAEIGEGAGLT
jgi:hypothetical protein